MMIRVEDWTAESSRCVSAWGGGDEGTHCDCNRIIGHQGGDDMTAQAIPSSKFSSVTLAFGALLGVGVLWSYWTTLGKIAWRWSEDPQYSHGYLVPAFALYLLWSTRERLSKRPLNVNWLGLGLLGLAGGLRLGGAYFSYDYFDQISLLPCCAGLILLAGSWPALFWACPAIAYLGFMIPLPDRVSLAMSAPMQSFATAVSTFALQVFGRPAIAEGNVILLNDIELGIVEACSGLRMLVVFFALSTAVAMMIRKPLWEKLLIAGSAIPIALASNVLRITITGLFYDTFGNHYGGAFFHDLAGWLMMPLGLIFLGVELWVLKTLLIERSNQRPLPAQITTQRVEVNPVAMYRSGQTPRREKLVAPEVEAASKETPIEPVPQAG
jgi:exosortase